MIVNGWHPKRTLSRPAASTLFFFLFVGLPPNTLHRVRVEARRTSGPNDPSQMNPQNLQRNQSVDELKRNSVAIEFHTAPIGMVCC